MSPAKRRSTPKKPTASKPNARGPKKPTRRAGKKPSAPRAKSRTKTVLKPKGQAAKNRPARGIPRPRRAHKPRIHALRQPVPNVQPRGREKTKLRDLSQAQRRAVDALLLRVYQQAARELASLETEAPSQSSAELAAHLAAREQAREELMQALRAWEARQQQPPPRTQ